MGDFKGVFGQGGSPTFSAGSTPIRVALYARVSTYDQQTLPLLLGPPGVSGILWRGLNCLPHGTTRPVKMGCPKDSRFPDPHVSSSLAGPSGGQPQTLKILFGRTCNHCRPFLGSSYNYCNGGFYGQRNHTRRGLR